MSYQSTAPGQGGTGVRPQGLDSLRSFHHRDFPLPELAAAKGSTTVSVCLPARNEAATIGAIAGRLRHELMGAGLVDEIVVIDDHSSDGTAEVAAAAGVTVAQAGDILTEHASGPGKGEALWKSLAVTSGDLVVWCDADIRDFDVRFVTGVLGPLLTHDDIDFVKGYYERPHAPGGGGGRVTELVARPLLSMLAPELCAFAQPLSGEFGGRRQVLEAVPFQRGYGVDVALLIDLARLIGLGAMAQVDLDVRVHRNRPLEDLGPQATVVAGAILDRLAPGVVGETVSLERPDFPPLDLLVSSCPPLSSLR